MPFIPDNLVYFCQKDKTDLWLMHFFVSHLHAIMSENFKDI
ncbi:hypothetical protein PRUB_b0092 [Pseudoalteromonas rubra]|uniref:Uncharacterized protein n=1 Tax=Pseudoalteromonas rubra TaxID=43658 RepID=A0A8T0C125_9GAMM|nr:hypothetical protein PRUB_b0092 [Pseudoalteromonas rubra]